jgi:hypothetical protein
MYVAILCLVATGAFNRLLSTHSDSILQKLLLLLLQY